MSWRLRLQCHSAHLVFWAIIGELRGISLYRRQGHEGSIVHGKPNFLLTLRLCVKKLVKVKLHPGLGVWSASLLSHYFLYYRPGYLWHYNKVYTDYAAKISSAKEVTSITKRFPRHLLRSISVRQLHLHLRSHLSPAIGFTPFIAHYRLQSANHNYRIGRLD